MVKPSVRGHEREASGCPFCGTENWCAKPPRVERRASLHHEPLSSDHEAQRPCHRPTYPAGEWTPGFRIAQLAVRPPGTLMETWFRPKPSVGLRLLPLFHDHLFVTRLPTRPDLPRPAHRRGPPSIKARSFSPVPGPPRPWPATQYPALGYGATGDTEPRGVMDRGMEEDTERGAGRGRHSGRVAGNVGRKLPSRASIPKHPS